MKKEGIYNLGKKLGLKKQDIEFILTYRDSNNKLVSTLYIPNCYKNGTLDGAISINDS